MQHSSPTSLKQISKCRPKLAGVDCRPLGRGCCPWLRRKLQEDGVQGRQHGVGLVQEGRPAEDLRGRHRGGPEAHESDD